MDDWKTKYLFPAIGMIPIDRGGGSAAQRALDTAAGVLDRGELFGIYPEGTRARDGLLHKGHTGPARLALRTGAPIVPVGIRGTRDIQPPDAKFPKPFKAAEIHFGRPITVDRYQGRDDDHLVYRQIIDEVMFEIRAALGPGVRRHLRHQEGRRRCPPRWPTCPPTTGPTVTAAPRTTAPDGARSTFSGADTGFGRSPGRQ